MKQEKYSNKTKILVGSIAACAGLIGIYASTRKTKYPEAKVMMIINAPTEAAFNYIPPINLMHIFPGTTLIPGIADTSIKEGWNKPGLTRTVYFKDGSTSQESLLTYEPSTYFSYKNENFTSPILKVLISRLEGQWHFRDLGNHQTKIEWTYRAIPMNAVTRLIVDVVLIDAIHSMMTTALTIAKNDLESGDLKGGRL